jgi:hypothetical protein
LSSSYQKYVIGIQDPGPGKNYSGSQIHDLKGTVSRIRNTGHNDKIRIMFQQHYMSLNFKANNPHAQERGCCGVLLLRRRPQRHQQAGRHGAQRPQDPHHRREQGESSGSQPLPFPFPFPYSIPVPISL